MTEKEIRTYCFIMDFDLHYTECPYAAVSFRYKLGEALNNFENKIPGTKETIVKNFLSLLPKLKKEFSTGLLIKNCSLCGQPTSHDVCKACTLKQNIG